MASNRMGSTSDLLKKFLKGDDTALEQLDAQLSQLLPLAQSEASITLPPIPSEFLQLAYKFEINQETLLKHLFKAGFKYQNEPPDSYWGKLKARFKNKELGKSRVTHFEENLREKSEGEITLTSKKLFREVVGQILSPKGAGVLETSYEYRLELAKSVMKCVREDFESQKTKLHKDQVFIIETFLNYVEVDNTNDFKGISRALKILNHLLFLNSEKMLGTLIHRILGDISNTLGDSKVLKESLKRAACDCFKISLEQRYRYESIKIQEMTNKMVVQGMSAVINQIAEEAITQVLKNKFVFAHPGCEVSELKPLTTSEESKNKGEGVELKDVNASQRRYSRAGK